MALTIFDLDNTLLNGDSDFEWGQFLVRKHLVDKDEYHEANIYFYEQYKKGCLDIVEFSSFSFKPLSIRNMEELKELHNQYMDEVILPMITDKARETVKEHHQKGDTLLVITATNSFVTRPIALELGITNLLATDPKIVNGRYTTEIEGTPCFQEGKVTRLNQWLKENNQSMKDSVFYSDSHNDLSLLEVVDTAITVDPDDILREIAKERNWEIISFR